MEKPSPFKAVLIWIAGVVTTLIIGDINGWFLSQKFPIVVYISGFQFSIGLASVLTLFVLVMMTLSFYLGFISPIHLFFRAILKTPVPLSFRIASIFFFPLGLIFKLRNKLTPKRQEPEKSEWAKHILEQLEQGKEQ